MFRGVSGHVRRNLVAYFALLVALSGTSYAAIELPANSVGKRQLKKNAVDASKVKDRSLLGRDFKRGQIPRGRPGAKGAKGDKGDTGQQGPAGPTDLSKFGRVAQATSTTASLTASAVGQKDVSLPLTITPGGPGYVVLSANPVASISSMTNCPCTAGFHIEASTGEKSSFYYTTISSLVTGGTYSATGWGSVGLFWVKQVSGATPLTFSVKGAIYGGTGAMDARSELSAIYVPFGSAGT